MNYVANEIFNTQPEAEARVAQLHNNNIPSARFFAITRLSVVDRRPGTNPPKPVVWSTTDPMFVVQYEE